MSFEGGAPPKKGMSSGSKVLIILGIVAGVGLLVCCGAGGFFFYKAKPTIKTVPAEVAAQSTAIVPLAVDETRWVGKNSLEQEIPFFMKWTYCVWEEKDGEGGMIVLGMTLPAAAQQGGGGGQTPDQAIEQALSQQPEFSTLKDLNIDKSEDKTVTMLGGEQTFKYIEGKRSGSDVEWIEWSGSIEKPGQITRIRIQIEKEKYVEQEIIDMLESAK